jgi:ribosome-binding factor A
MAAWTKGKTKVGRTAKATSKDANKFDWKLLYREPSLNIKFKLGEDKGKILIPKLFRRQSSWMLAKKSGVIAQHISFQSYLKNAPDQLILLKDLLTEGLHSAKVFALHEFVSADNEVLKNLKILFSERNLVRLKIQEEPKLRNGSFLNYHEDPAFKKIWLMSGYPHG